MPIMPRRVKTEAALQHRQRTFPPFSYQTTYQNVKSLIKLSFTNKHLTSFNNRQTVQPTLSGNGPCLSTISHISSIVSPMSLLGCTTRRQSTHHYIRSKRKDMHQPRPNQFVFASNIDEYYSPASSSNIHTY
jgi:hypothetical protein